MEPFRVTLPESGLVLVRGLNKDTGDSSASGKSSFVLAISHLFGGCKYPGTTLQSWHSEDPYLVGAVIATAEGDWTIERSKGLKVVSPDGTTIKGKAAESELDKIFGMDSWLRSMATYRGQKQDGLFLSMPDQDKKEFFTKALRLNRYEKVAADAAEAAKELKDKFLFADGQLSLARSLVEQTKEVFDTLPPAEEADEGNLDELRAAVAGAEKNRDLAITAAEEAASKILKAGAKEAEKILADSNISFGEDTPEVKEALLELPKVNERLNKAIQHDIKKRQELEETKSNLKLRLYQATKEAEKKTALESTLKKLQDQKQHLLEQICPTCEQSWVTTSAQKQLEKVNASILETETQISKAVAAAEEAEQRSAEIKSFPPFTPHPFEQRLKERLEVLNAIVGEVRQNQLKQAAAHSAQAQSRARAVRAEAEIQATTAKQTHLKVAYALKQEIDNLNQIIRFNESRVAAAKALAENRKRAEQAYSSAVKRLDAAHQKYVDIKKQIDCELDLNLMVGRTGFLGVIFDDVLAEVAAATNEVSSRVANVRHVTFSFDSEKESQSGSIQRRIIPVVTIDGRSVDFDAGLSGGMQSAIKLAVDLGVGEVVAKRRGSYPGWLVLDESFDGLGRASKESCLEMLQAYAGDRLVLVIDHSSEFQGLFQQVITITSSNGRSTIS